MHATVPPPDENHQAIVPLLESSLAQTHAQGIYLYSFPEAEKAPQLVLWAGLPPGFGGEAGELGSADFHASRNLPIVLREGAYRDWRFCDFAEFRRHRFEGVASIPAVDSGTPTGFAHVCRTGRSSLTPGELAFLLNLSRPLGTLLATGRKVGSLSRQIEQLTEQLAGRKLVERAKGLLQARMQYTEEQAYLLLRRTSRQRRVKMSKLAAEIIERGGVGAEFASGGLLRMSAGGQAEGL